MMKYKLSKHCEAYSSSHILDEDGAMFNSEVVKRLNSLTNENKQLMEKLDFFQKRTIDLGEQLDYAKDENNELKDKLDNIRKEVINVDMFSDEALNHDIIAYREMQEFDNKDCYDIAWAIEKISKECFDE